MPVDKDPTSSANLVLDTDAVIDATSFHGIAEAMERADEPKLRHRVERLGAAFLFVWGCRTTGVRVGSAPDELQRILTKIYKKDADDSNSAMFGMFYAHYVLEFVLPPFEFGFLDGIPTGLRGTKVDDALLDKARETGFGLVTNEGWSPDGISGGDLRQKAIEAQVQVWTTKEWVLEHFESREPLIADFCQCFLDSMPTFLASREHQGDNAEGSLRNMLGYLEQSMRAI